MPVQFPPLKHKFVTLYTYCFMHCPHMHGLIKGQASHTPSFYSPCLLCNQGDKIHKTETMTSCCKDKDDKMGTGQALSRSLGKTEVTVCLSHPTNTLRGCMSGGYFSFKRTQNILTFESLYLLWLRRTDLSVSNQEFSLTFLRGDINTCA